MKIRHPMLIWAAGFIGAWLVRLWIWTLRYRYCNLGPDVRPQGLPPGQRYIFAFWHEYLLLPAYHYGRPDIWVLISQHADGQIIAEICRHLGFGLVRGSTTRGGVEAVRRMLHSANQASLAITPDGPRGPRRQVQSGLIYVAAKTGLPIVPIGFGFRKARRLSSWDRFALPRPFTFGTCVTLEPIGIPADFELNQLDHYRKLVEDAMLHATAMAERWAATGRQPDSAPASELAA
jgi:lysophospholipid acyltransferase (LPLAT)-like uncharacterized protein